MYSKLLEKVDKVTQQVACFNSLEHFQMKPALPIYVLQSLQGHLSIFQNILFSLNFASEFAFLVVLGINSHNLRASEDMFSVPKYTVRFHCLCSSGSFLKFYGFYIKRKVSFIILDPKSFFVL